MTGAYLIKWAGQLSRYSGWIRAGRSGDRIPVGGEIFRTCRDRPWGPPSLLYNGYRVFPGSKEQPGRDADPSPSSSAVVMKEQSYTSTPPVGRTACTEPQCLYKGALYLISVPVQGCTLPLPFIESKPVQSRRNCNAPEKSSKHKSHAYSYYVKTDGEKKEVFKKAFVVSFLLGKSPASLYYCMPTFRKSSETSAYNNTVTPRT